MHANPAFLSCAQSTGKTATIQRTLLDQIFGFDRVAEAQPCRGTTSAATPCNGEHNAGPVAFITRPNATSGLGPLCTHAVKKAGVFSCQP